MISGHRIRNHCFFAVRSGVNHGEKLKVSPPGATELHRAAPVRQMDLLLFLSALLLVGAVAAAITPSQGSRRSPKEVVEQLCSSDADGGRLTAEGWYRSARFFLHPEPMPSVPTVVVMKGAFAIGSAELDGSQARVGVEYLMLGRIDSTMHFAWAGDSPGPVKWRSFYTLVLTDVHSEFKEDRRSLHEVRGPLEWRIKDFQPQPVVSVATAIRFVESQRRSADPAIRRNADRTLALLANYK